MDRKIFFSFALFLLFGNDCVFGQWAQCGGLGTGQVTAFSSIDSTIFIGTSSLGVFQSTNWGNKWIPVSAQLTNADIYSMVAIDTTLIASISTKSLNGIYISRDRGTTWNFIADWTSRILATNNSIFFSKLDGSILRSTTEGSTWDTVGTGYLLCSDKNDVYAEKNDGVIFRLDDSSDFWVPLDTAFYGSVNTYYSDSSVLYAWTSQNVYALIDIHNGWRKIFSVDTGSIVGVSRTRGTLFVGTSAGLFQSMDNGKNWILNSLESFVPIQIGSDWFGYTSSYGIFRSTDLGHAWEEVDSGISSGNIHCIISGPSGLIISDNEGVHRSDDGARTWHPIGDGTVPQVGSLCEIGDIIIGSPSIRGTTITSSDYGILRIRNSATKWQRGIVGSKEDIVNCLLGSGSNILAGTADEGLYLSQDSGQTWESINSGLLDSTSISSIAEIGSNLFVASDSGIFYSIDLGKSWHGISTGLTTRKVNAFGELGTTLFAGTYNRGVFRALSGGPWISSNSGIESYTISSFASFGNVIFCGVPDFGVFLSLDSGKSWASVNEGLGDSNITSLSIDGNELLAGTDNRGVWRRPISEMIPSRIISMSEQQSQSLSIYPNPISRTATIQFSASNFSLVSITVYGMLGNPVQRMFEGNMAAGNHSVPWNAGSLPNGMYECVVRAGETQIHTQIVISH